MAKGVGHLESLIEGAWDYRYAQKSELFISEIAKVFHEIPELKLTPPTVATLPVLFGSLEATHVQEVVLLQVSSLRYQLRLEEAGSLITALNEYLASHGMSPSFRLLFEQGNQAIFSGDFANALERYTRSLPHAKTSFQKAIALSNQIVCFQELGLKPEETEAQLEALIQTLDTKRPGFIGIKRQVEAMRLRQAFRRGDVKTLLESKFDLNSGFASYLNLFYKEIPYLQLPSPLNSETASLFNDGFSLSPYRSRTLLGLVHPDDALPPKPSEWVDRFYLWVWRWLLTLESSELDKVMLLLRYESEVLSMERLTQEDRQMLKNGLLWLSLFDPASRFTMPSIVQRLNHTDSKQTSLLSFEYLLVSYLIAVRDGDRALMKSLRSSLEVSPFFKEKENGLSEILQAAEGRVTSETFKPLSQYLLTLLKKEKHQEQARFSVDPFSFLLTDREKGLELISEPAAKALVLLSQRKAVPLPLLLATCFGIERFDVDIHQAKVSQLLSRIKPLFGEEFTFGIKSGSVYAKGDWNRIEFATSLEHSVQPRHYAEWREFLQKRKHFDFRNGVVTSKNQKHVADVLSRSELEIVVGKSRATTNRLISNWEKDGLLIRTGRSKNTRYKISDRLKNKLETEGVYE